MIKKSVLIIMLTIIMIAGCGGGGGGPIVPTTHDLSGLEGTWTGAMSVTGNIDFPAYGNFNAESIPVATTYPFEWHFTKNTITGSQGQDFVWTYDGAILTIKYSTTERLDAAYPECGAVYVSDVVTMTIPITPTATSGIITGSITETWITESCGTGYGVLVKNGNIHK